MSSKGVPVTGVAGELSVARHYLQGVSARGVTGPGHGITGPGSAPPAASEAMPMAPPMPPTNVKVTINDDERMPPVPTFRVESHSGVPFSD
jgi:hypothetical protein